MNINTLPSDTVAKATTKALNSLFEAQQGKDVLFLTSGGSWLTILNDIDSTLFGPRSTIGVIDERYSTNPTINNFAQLEKTEFYKKTKERGAHCIDTKIYPGESTEDVAARFEKELREWEEKTHGTIIVAAGIGPDAHTAGIMPYPERTVFFERTFNDEVHWAVAYDAHNKTPHRMRITTTLPFLRKVHSVIIFAVGENKKQALKKCVAENGTLSETPCRIWREIPDATLYTDQTI